MAVTFFEKYGANLVGAIFNNIPPLSTYHTYDECKAQVDKYLTKRLPSVVPFGFVPRHEGLWQLAQSKPPASDLCILRIPKGDPLLQMTEDDAKLVATTINWVGRYVKVKEIVNSLGMRRAMSISVGLEEKAIPEKDKLSIAARNLHAYSPLSPRGSLSSPRGTPLSPGAILSPLSSPRKMAENPNIAYATQMKRLAAAVLGGLTEAQIFHEWRMNHNSNTRSKSEIQDLVTNLVAKFPELYRASLVVAVRKVQSVPIADKEKLNALHDGLKRDLTPLWDALEKNYKSMAEPQKAKLLQQLFEMLPNKEEPTSLSQFTELFRETVGPALVQRLLPTSNGRGELAAIARRCEA